MLQQKQRRHIKRTCEMEFKKKMMMVSRRSQLVILFVGLLTAIVGLPASSSAHVLELVDGNSVVRLDPHSQAGLKDWEVEGVDHQAQHWFWFRTGSAGHEVSLDTLPLLNEELHGSDHQLHVRYGGPVGAVRSILHPASLQVDIVYQLMGGAPGTGGSWFDQLVTLKNTGTTPLPLEWFEYNNLDLSGSGPGDIAQFFPSGGIGGPDLLGQADLGDPLTLYIERGMGVSPSHFEIGPYASILSRLNDGLPTTLLDGINPYLTPDDIAFAFQYHLFLEPGASIAIARLMDINDDFPHPPVPEPGTFVLLGSGLLPFFFRRRKLS